MESRMDGATESITKELFCPFCNHKYQWKNILLAHIKYSHQATLWCSKCKYVSKDEQSLRIHMKSIHEQHRTDEISQSIGNKSDKKKKLEKFHCPECKKVCNSQQSLRYHKNAKHKGVKHLCNQCDYQAVTQCLWPSRK